VSVKKKGKGRQSSVVVDQSYLACQHHVAMVAGMACVHTDDITWLLGRVVGHLLYFHFMLVCSFNFMYNYIIIYMYY